MEARKKVIVGLVLAALIFFLAAPVLGVGDQVEAKELKDGLSALDAIDISIGNATVMDFLNGVDKATIQVYNTKQYDVNKTKRVQWTSLDSSIDVYVNVETSEIIRIEKKDKVVPILYHEKITRYDYDSTACSYTLYDSYGEAQDFEYRISHNYYIDNYAACPADWSVLTLREDNYCKFEDTTFDWSTYMRYLMQGNSSISAKYPWFPYP
jgi:hypothetical protein